MSVNFNAVTLIKKPLLFCCQKNTAVVKQLDGYVFMKDNTPLCNVSVITYFSLVTCTIANTTVDLTLNCSFTALNLVV